MWAAAFMDDRTYTRAQIDFVWVVVTHLTEAGVMDADRLYEAPFTDHAPPRARRPVQRLRRR